MTQSLKKKHVEVALHPQEPSTPWSSPPPSRSLPSNETACSKQASESLKTAVSQEVCVRLSLQSRPGVTHSTEVLGHIAPKGWGFLQVEGGFILFKLSLRTFDAFNRVSSDMYLRRS